MLTRFLTILTAYISISCVPCIADVPFNQQVNLMSDLKRASDVLRLENQAKTEERIRIMRSLLDPSNGGSDLISRILQQGSQVLQRGVDSVGRLVPNSSGSNPLTSLLQPGSNPLGSILQQGTKTAQEGGNIASSLLSRSSGASESLGNAAGGVQRTLQDGTDQVRKLLSGGAAGGSNALQGGASALTNILNPQNGANLLRGLIPSNSQGGSNPVGDLVRQGTKSLQDGASGITSLLQGGLSPQGRNSRATNSNPISNLINGGFDFLKFLRNLMSNRRTSM